MYLMLLKGEYNVAVVLNSIYSDKKFITKQYKKEQQIVIDIIKNLWNK